MTSGLVETHSLLSYLWQFDLFLLSLSFPDHLSLSNSLPSLFLFLSLCFNSFFPFKTRVRERELHRRSELLPALRRGRSLARATLPPPDRVRGRRQAGQGRRGGRNPLSGWVQLLRRSLLQCQYYITVLVLSVSK